MSKINALYWECYSCEFTTPRHPDTKKKQMGKCPKCSADAWMKKKVCKKCNGYGWISDTTLKGFKYCDNCNKTGKAKQ